PNGCGKSNVVDAIRWVMGEMSAKSLRGKSMEDVIFAGSESRQPLGMAEVSLTFSTEDGLIPAEYASFSEITVTRRLFRSGESEYLLNKIPCRLKDIVELFLGTGVGHKAYSVIEQGRIDFAINAKPEDRRSLIEEAAGISKFKIRKEAALRRIEGTKTNLIRLADILKEIRRQIGSLDRQVRKAEKYKELKTELRELELQLASKKITESDREESELSALFADWQTRETKAEAAIASVETNLETRRLTLTEKEQEIATLQEKIYEITNQIQLLEAQDGFRLKETESLKKQMEGWIAESEQTKERLLTLESEREGSSEEVQKILDQEKAVSQQLVEIEATVRRFIEEQNFLQKKIEEEKNLLSQSLRDMATGDSRREGLEGRRIDLKGRLARVVTEAEEIDRHCRTVEEGIIEIQRILDQKKQERALLEQQVGETRKTLLTEREAREIAEMELTQKREETVLRRSRLKSLIDLERNFEGYQQGVRSILRVKKQEGKMMGVLGVVADYIDSPPQYEVAVTAALGDKLQSLIVEDHDQGIDAISYLKTGGGGRSSFIPLEPRSNPYEEFPQGEGVIGPLLNLIQVKGNFEKLGRYLFGDVILVESLARALSLWRGNGHKKTLVTLDGEMIDPHGVVSGGRGDSGGQALLEKKREMKELKTEIAEIEVDLDWKEDVANQKAAKISSLDIHLENIQRELHEASMAIGSLEKDKEHEETEKARYLERKITLEVEQRQLMEEMSGVTQEMEAGVGQKGELSLTKAQKEEQIRFHQEKLKEVSEELERHSLQLTNIKVETASVTEKKNHLQARLGKIEDAKRELEEATDRRLADLTNANHRLVDLKMEGERDTAALEQHRLSLDQLKTDYEQRRQGFDSLNESQRTEELSIRDVRKEHDLARSHTSDLKVTLTQLKSDREHLIAQMLEKYSMDLTQGALPALPEEFNAEETGTCVEDLKDKLSKMGDVNLGAIPEYEELKTRNDFLTKQYEDLEKSLDSLQKAISRINQTTRKRFKETLDLINEKFTDLFPRLFRGGRAQISLTDPNDLLNSGVEIMVQPPGKKLQHVSLLSGGEKALSATALVFSIFLVKPSPFCILDEVDAPLDDTNVDRFQELIREMTQRTQFILISHNKRTMEMADTLYGVTMQEPGSSKIVSVKLNSEKTSAAA
ncbi:MAG: chromosome segregation protein SMC, partial [bacterium]|nr:chromosome segregation protein SMC [bacterium]